MIWISVGCNGGKMALKGEVTFNGLSWLSLITTAATGYMSTLRSGMVELNR